MTARQAVANVRLVLWVLREMAGDAAARVLVWAWKRSPQGRAHMAWVKQVRKDTAALRRAEFGARLDDLRRRDR
jgi:hypothetical protein